MDVDYRDFSYDMEVLDSIKAIQQESIELEEQFEEVLVLREPRPEDMNLLKKALDKQKEYLAAIAGVDSEAVDRQLNLEERYQNLAAESLQLVSLDLESKAEAYVAQLHTNVLQELHAAETRFGEQESRFACEMSRLQSQLQAAQQHATDTSCHSKACAAIARRALR